MLIQKKLLNPNFMQQEKEEMPPLKFTTPFGSSWIPSKKKWGLMEMIPRLHPRKEKHVP